MAAGGKTTLVQVAVSRGTTCFQFGKLPSICFVMQFQRGVVICTQPPVLGLGWTVSKHSPSKNPDQARNLLLDRFTDSLRAKSKVLALKRARPLVLTMVWHLGSLTSRYAPWRV